MIGIVETVYLGCTLNPSILQDLSVLDHCSPDFPNTLLLETWHTPACLPASHIVSGAQIHHILGGGHESWFSALRILIRGYLIGPRMWRAKSLLHKTLANSRHQASPRTFQRRRRCHRYPSIISSNFSDLNLYVRLQTMPLFPWALGISRSREVMSDSRRRICRPDRQSRTLDTSRDHRMRLS